MEYNGSHTRLLGHMPYGNCGHSYAYLKDIEERLPTQPASRLGELLPYRWQAPLVPD